MSQNALWSSFIDHFPKMPVCLRSSGRAQYSFTGMTLKQIHCIEGSEGVIFNILFH